MTVFLALLLTVAAFICATYPLLKRKPPLAAGSVEDENLEELHSRRDTTYSMLKELEFDYQSGILSEDDYQALRNRYKQKAATILKDMDSLQESGEADDEIEAKVAGIRGRKGHPGEKKPVADEIEQRILELRRTASAPKKQKVTGDEIEQRVLALRRTASSPKKQKVTGDEIEQRVLELRKNKGQYCPQCGEQHENDHFCKYCGTKLA